MYEIYVYHIERERTNTRRRIDIVRFLAWLLPSSCLSSRTVCRTASPTIAETNTLPAVLLILTADSTNDIMIVVLVGTRTGVAKTNDASVHKWRQRGIHIAQCDESLFYVHVWRNCMNLCGELSSSSASDRRPLYLRAYQTQQSNNACSRWTYRQSFSTRCLLNDEKPWTWRIYVAFWMIQTSPAVCTTVQYTTVVLQYSAVISPVPTNIKVDYSPTQATLHLEKNLDLCVIRCTWEVHGKMCHSTSVRSIWLMPHKVRHFLYSKLLQ